MSDLAELFSRDPMTYQTQDIDTIIARLREARANFNLAGKTEKLKPAAKKATGEKVDLSDLGLE